jgi:aminoglycoside 6-adenylyltransferase
LDWYIGVKTNWQANPGGYGKWFNRFLPPEIMASLEKAYPGADPDQTWEALFEMGRLFRRVGGEVAGALGYTYPVGDDERVMAFLKRVRALPREAQSI